MRYKVTTPPDEEPITLARAKEQCRVEHTLEDSLINGYIAAAREVAEQRTGRPLINRTVELALDAFPAGEIELPFSPLVSVVSIRYINTAGTEVTLSASNYTIDDYGLRNWILPAHGITWPETFASANAVKVQFVAGFGATADDISVKAPAAKSWMLLAVEALYQHRGLLSNNQAYTLPDNFCDSLINTIKIWRC